MKREKLLRSREYWLVQIQNDLFGAIENYMQKKKLNRTKLAEKLGVTKGYVTQVLNGDFDHKVSKLVDLSLASNKAPILCFVDMDLYIKEDSNNKTFELISMERPRRITYENIVSFPKNEEIIKPQQQLNPIIDYSNNYQNTLKAKLDEFYEDIKEDIKMKQNEAVNINSFKPAA